MRLELALTDAERVAIRRQCEEAIEMVEAIHREMVPHDDLKQEFVGTRGSQVTAIVMGFGAGAISLVLWRWIFNFVGLADFMAAHGLPKQFWAAPAEFLGLVSAAYGSWFVAHSWGVEGRIQKGTQAFNAHERSSVLHSVVEELSGILPGADPDMGAYADSHEDSRPNHLIEAALGRSKQK